MLGRNSCPNGAVLRPSWRHIVYSASAGMQKVRWMESAHPFEYILAFLEIKDGKNMSHLI